MTRRVSLRWALGLLLGALGLYLSARAVRWPQVWAVLSRAHVIVVAAALASSVLTSWFKAVRWRLLLFPHHQRMPFPRMLALVFAGQLANSILPGRLGDLVRTYLASEDLGGALVTGATVVAEKALDGIMLLALAALAALATPLPPWLKRSTLLLSGALVAALAAAIAIVWRGGGGRVVLRRWAQRQPRWEVVKVFEQAWTSIGQLEVLHSLRAQGQLVALSALIWVLACTSNVLVFLALGLGAQPLVSAVLLVVLMTGAIIPTVPAQLGVFHYLCVLTLNLFAFGPDTSLSYAFLLHLVVYAPIAIGGAAGLWWLSGNTVLWRPGQWRRE